MTTVNRNISQRTLLSLIFDLIKSISFCIPSDNGAADSGIFGSESERFLNGFDSSNQMPLFNQTTTVDVHSPDMQNGFIDLILFTFL
jgi:hypothetical protein